MRIRSLILILLAVLLAGGTTILGRAWLQEQRSKNIQEAVAVPLPTPAKSVLVARDDIRRGQILRPNDAIWQVWPEGGLDKNYVVIGGPKTPESFSGWVARNPISGGEPITEGKIIAPGDRGFLAAVLRPGTRAISVPVTATSGISGFVFPGDEVDLLVTFQMPSEPVAAEAGRSTNEHKAARTVLQKIRVIAIDQATRENKSGEAVVAHTATFEVTPKQSEIISLASEIGKVTLTLRSLVPTPKEIAAAGDATAETAAESPVAATETYTVDSEIISPLRAAGEKHSHEPTVVTIFHGSEKTSESKGKP